MKLEFLQKELDRVNDWVKFADKKAGFLIVVYSIIIGFLKIKYGIFNFDGKVKCILLFLFLLSLILGICFLLKTLFPKTKNELTDNNIIFFGNISSMKYKDFTDKYNNITEEEMKQNIFEQIYTNSVRANDKFKNIKKSTICLMVSIVLLIFLFIK